MMKRAMGRRDRGWWGRSHDPTPLEGDVFLRSGRWVWKTGKEVDHVIKKIMTNTCTRATTIKKRVGITCKHIKNPLNFILKFLIMIIS